MFSSTHVGADGICEFHENGYLKIPSFLGQDEVARYGQLYDRFLDGTICVGHLRSDLAGTDPSLNTKQPLERITQIMWPSALVATLLDGPLHRRAVEAAKCLLGGDMDVDFDMLIDKAPHTDAPTPWHQDAAYWHDLPDRRAVSVWVSLDEATVENGCMWYVPGSHLQAYRKHHQSGGAGPLICECSEEEGVAVPLKPGDATIHHGGTLHYSRGNRTDSHRRAMIVNCRPASMIRLERERGVDHGLSLNERQVRNSSLR